MLIILYPIALKTLRNILIRIIHNYHLLLETLRAGVIGLIMSKNNMTKKMASLILYIPLEYSRITPDAKKYFGVNTKKYFFSIYSKVFFGSILTGTLALVKFLTAGEAIYY